MSDLSNLNNHDKPIANGVTWSGSAEDTLGQPSTTVAVKTDKGGILYVDYSTDAINWDSTLSYSVKANVNEVHRITNTRRWVRLRFLNNSGENQTYFRLQVRYGNEQSLTSNLSSQIQSDADTLVVRPLDFNLLIAEGLYENRNNTIKDGFNAAISTGSVPEDITNEGGLYTGFPTGAVEAGEIVVAGADTGTVFYAYLATADDEDYTFGSVAIVGAGSYPLGHNIWRCNFAYFVATSQTATNVNTITIRNTVTTTNVFCVIPTGYGQSFCAAYTVPANSSVYLDRITGTVRGSTSGTLDGSFYYREATGGFRLRFPFELQFGSLYFDDVDYLIKIPQKTDIIPRIISASTNNLQAKISYRLIKVKE